MVTDPQTNKPTDRLQYTAQLSLARSVVTVIAETPKHSHIISI